MVVKNSIQRRLSWGVLLLGHSLLWPDPIFAEGYYHFLYRCLMQGTYTEMIVPLYEDSILHETIRDYCVLIALSLLGERLQLVLAEIMTHYLHHCHTLQK